MLGVGEGRGGLGWAGLGWAGLGWAGLGWAAARSPQLSLLNVPGGRRTITIDLLQFPYALVSQTSKGPPVWRVTAGCMRDILYETDYAAPVAPPQVMQIYGVETRSALRLSRPNDLKFFCCMKFMLVNIF